MMLDATMTQERPTSLRRKTLVVEVVLGPDVGRRVVMKERLRIGSRALADLVLSDPKISGLHCELSWDGDLFLKDLSSKNGTQIGAVRILEAVLPIGGTFRIGDTHLKVEGAGETYEVPLYPKDDFFGLIGSSPRMRALAAELQMLAHSDASVLIHGETGTGKERVAQALHLARPGPPSPFIAVDCASLPAGLIEAELFGHVKGAFTGAVRSNPGVFARAGKGTVFLDEIGELPLELQPRLLRALGNRMVYPLGGGAPVPVEARVLSATNRDLQLEVAKGRFREDLYFRLAVVTVKVPPLRAHKDDIPLIASHVLQQLDIEPNSVLSPETLRVLTLHDWPGNVRELENALTRAVTLMEPVAPEATSPLASVASDVTSAPAPEVDLKVPFRAAKQRAIDAFERAYLTGLLEKFSHNISEVARAAKVERATVYRTLQRLGLKPTGTVDDGEQG